MSLIVKFGGGLLIFLVATLAGFAAFHEDRPGIPSASAMPAATAAPEPPPPAEPVRILSVTARQLWMDYDANEVSADNAYRGRLLAVDGVIASIGKDFRENIIIGLVSPNQFMPVHATLRPSEAATAAAMRKGRAIDLVCVGGGKTIGRPTLDDCVFAR